MLNANMSMRTSKYLPDCNHPALPPEQTLVGFSILWFPGSKRQYFDSDGVRLGDDRYAVRVGMGGMSITVKVFSEIFGHLRKKCICSY